MLVELDSLIFKFVFLGMYKFFLTKCLFIFQGNSSTASGEQVQTHYIAPGMPSPSAEALVSRPHFKKHCLKNKAQQSCLT